MPKTIDYGAAYDLLIFSPSCLEAINSPIENSRKAFLLIIIMASYFVTIWRASAWVGLAGVAPASGAFFLANHPDRILILFPADADLF